MCFSGLNTVIEGNLISRSKDANIKPKQQLRALAVSSNSPFCGWEEAGTPERDSQAEHREDILREPSRKRWSPGPEAPMLDRDSRHQTPSYISGNQLFLLKAD